MENSHLISAHYPFQYHELVEVWKDLLRTGMREDGWEWDWTSLGALKEARTDSAIARVIAKADGVWVGEGIAMAVNDLAKLSLVSKVAKDKTQVKAGDLVAEWSGPARMILAFERPFLNLSSYASGIATATARMVKKIEMCGLKKSPRLVLTRKTLPGYRDVAIHAVRCGGGYPHRVSLSGGVLIKENHIAAAGGMAEAVRGVRGQAPHGLKIEAEVRSLEDLRSAIEADVDAVLLDNFSPDQVREALILIRQLDSRCVIEVSGGITEANISDFVIEGVDILSVGSITHSVRALDLSLLVESA